MTRGAALMSVLGGLALGGCGAAGSPAPPPAPFDGGPGALRPLVTAAAPVGVTIGSGRAFRRPAPPTTAAGCLPDAGPRHGAHVELFAAGRIVVLAPGIGMRGARLRDGRVVAASCSARLRTVDSSGVVEVLDGARADLGELFDLWDQRLSPRRLGDFRGVVRAYLDGRRVIGDPRAIVLSRHAQVVLAVGPEVPVHASYRFRPGL